MAGVVAGFIVYVAALVTYSIWLAAWTDDALLPDPREHLTLRLSVYGGIGSLLSESLF